MLINNWEYLRLQIFGHQLAILHYIGGVGRIDGDVLQCRAAFESLISQGLLSYKNHHLRIPESQMFISDSIISTLFKT